MGQKGTVGYYGAGGYSRVLWGRREQGTVGYYGTEGNSRVLWGRREQYGKTVGSRVYTMNK